MKRIKIDVYAKRADVLGEGPLWSAADQTLYWLDIARKRLYGKALSQDVARSWQFTNHPGCMAEIRSGQLAIAIGDGVYRFDLDTEAIDQLFAVPRARAGTRFNDGKVDPRGRFWAGSMQNNFGPNGESIEIERADGALYRFDGDGGAHILEEDIGIANTLAWSPDLKRFYFADSPRGQIYVYDFDADSGEIDGKRLFFETPGFGVPDGSAIDSDGCLWNARWDGSALLRITPDGHMDRVIPLPIPRPTSCCFGGSGLDTLFVTSARIGLTVAQCVEFPDSGSVFAIHGMATGLPVPAFAYGPSRVL